MGRSPSRPVNFANPGYETSGGPGTYDPAPQYNFGNDVKTFTIGERRTHKIETDNRDYSPERAEALTRPKVAQVDMGACPSRPSTFAKPGYDDVGGPGQYDPAPQYDFGKDVKSFTIGEKRVEKVEYDNRDYSPDRCEALTKPKVPQVDMGKSPSRPVNFAKPGYETSGGPG